MSSRAKSVIAACGVMAVVLLVGIAAYVTREPAPAAKENTSVTGATPADMALSDGLPAVAALPQPPPEVEAAPEGLMVEVQGAVARPGVYRFVQGARVHDALQKAGGAVEHADTRDLNIAALLMDGSVLSVPYRQGGGAIQPGAADLNPAAYTRSGWSAAGEPSAFSTSTDTPSPTRGMVNLNSATKAELETLPGVGEKTAEKIIQFREAQRFTQVDDLKFIQGIGEKRMETLRPHVTVE